MDFSLTDDQKMIRDAALDYLSKASDSASIRAAMAQSLGYAPAVWQTISQELGWCGLAIPEDVDGLGMGPVELMLVQEQAGYHLLCAPFFSSVCLATTLINCIATDDIRKAWLPLIAGGERRLTSWLTPSADDWTVPGLVAEQTGAAWSVSGELAAVADADADGLVLFAETTDGVGLFLIEKSVDGLQTSPASGWDETRRFHRVELAGVVATRIDDQDKLDGGCQQAAALVRLYIAAEQLGSAQCCLDLTVEYISERKQFGRLIGSFQAIKHRCAEMMVQIEATRSAVYGAAAVAAAADDANATMMECAVAKALATETLFFCAGEAIQLHGGVGFTYEYDPQLYFKRAQASKHWMGTPTALRARIADYLL